MIAAVLEEHNIQSAEDIQEELIYLLGGTIQNMMEDELTGYS